tara:strand:- start:622 stop:990 length:369 start_codon:yes stop_codon:yes gene_type:complete
MDSKNNKIDYKDLMDLGFNHANCHDSVWKRVHGFDWFIVSLDIGRINFDWDIFTREVTMNEINKDYSIGRSKNIEGLQDLKNTMILIQKSYEKYETVKIENKTIYDSFLNDYFNDNEEENTE